MKNYILAVLITTCACIPMRDRIRREDRMRDRIRLEDRMRDSIGPEDLIGDDRIPGSSRGDEHDEENPPDIPIPSPPPSPPPTTRQPISTCEVYGDPQINTFGGAHIACSALRWQNVLSNKYVTIKGFMSTVSTRDQFPYMTKVEIKFHMGNNSVVMGKYQAGFSSLLPNTFTGGAAALYYAGSSVQAVTMSSTSNSNKVRMKYNDANIDIIVTKMLFGTYSLAVSQPVSLNGNSQGQCVHGCTNRTDIQKVIDEAPPRDDDPCADVPEEFYQSCLFDFIETGNGELAARTGRMINNIVHELLDDTPQWERAPGLRSAI